MKLEIKTGFEIWKILRNHQYDDSFQKLRKKRYVEVESLIKLLSIKEWSLEETKTFIKKLRGNSPFKKSARTPKA